MFSTTSFIFQTDIKLLPSITYPDIVNYLVFNPSPFTAQHMKAFKSLEADNYLSSGWMKDIHVWNVPQKPYFLIKAKVIFSSSVQ